MMCFRCCAFFFFWYVCEKGCDVILSPPPVSKTTADSVQPPACHWETVHLNAAPELRDTHQRQSPCAVANATCSPAWGVYFSVEVLH